jgi:peptidoglycan-associated lipoprotein
MGKTSLFTRRILYGAGFLVGCLALTGCPKRPEVALAVPSAPGPAAATAPRASMSAVPPKTAEVPVTRPAIPAEAALRPSPAAAVELGLKDIFFDFDNSVIRSDQRPAVEQDFAYLKAHPQVKVTVEGYCDERGTEEYNLALGQRRAEAAKQALVAEGIAADRINTISYGEDKPFAPGHDEDAWRLNRRDHFAMAP